MQKTTEIIKLIKPIVISSRIETFDELKEYFINNIPEFTMLPLDFFEAALNVLPKKEILQKGDWVEIGVWRGGGALFLKALMNDLNITRQLHLYDTFGIIPTNNLSHKKDLEFVAWFGIEENKVQQENYLIDVENRFKETELQENVAFHACDITQVPTNLIPNNIAFLHLDVDFYEPTFSALNLFYDNVISGGKVIIDDYYMQLLNCKDAVDDFFNQRNIDISAISEKFSMYSIIITKP